MYYNSRKLVAKGQRNGSTSKRKNNFHSKEIRAQQNLNTNIHNPCVHLDYDTVDLLDETNIYERHGADSNIKEDTDIYRKDPTTLVIGRSSVSSKAKSNKAWKRAQNKLREAIQIALEVAMARRGLDATMATARAEAKATRGGREAVGNQLPSIELYIAEILRTFSSNGKSYAKLDKYHGGITSILAVYESGRSMFIREWHNPQSCGLHKYIEVNKYCKSMEFVLDVYDSGIPFYVPTE